MIVFFLKQHKIKLIISILYVFIQKIQIIIILFNDNFDGSNIIYLFQVNTFNITENNYHAILHN